LQRYFGECCSLDLATPTVKDPNRTPDASTIRRWFRKLDSAQRLDCLQKLQPDLPDLPESAAFTRLDKPSSFPFLRQMIAATADRIASGKILRYGELRMATRTRVMPVKPNQCKEGDSKPVCVIDGSSKRSDWRKRSREKGVCSCLAQF
jgi:hypothetical protein